MLGKKQYLNVSDLAGYCRSFFECSALVRVLAGDRYSSAGMSTRSFIGMTIDAHFDYHDSIALSQKPLSRCYHYRGILS